MKIESVSVNVEEIYLNSSNGSSSSSSSMRMSIPP